MTLPVYFKLLRLKNANDELLKLYTTLFLYESKETCEGSNYPIPLRVRFREKVKRELNQCINNAQNAFKGLDKVYIDGYLKLLEIEKFSRKIFSSISGKECNEVEITNLERYYDLLYTPNVPRKINDLLLNQKSNIEKYLLK